MLRWLSWWRNGDLFDECARLCRCEAARDRPDAVSPEWLCDKKLNMRSMFICTACSCESRRVSLFVEKMVCHVSVVVEDLRSTADTASSCSTTSSSLPFGTGYFACRQMLMSANVCSVLAIVPSSGVFDCLSRRTKETEYCGISCRQCVWCNRRIMGLLLLCRFGGRTLWCIWRASMKIKLAGLQWCGISSESNCYSACTWRHLKFTVGRHRLPCAYNTVLCHIFGQIIDRVQTYCMC